MTEYSVAQYMRVQCVLKSNFKIEILVLLNYFLTPTL
jgi:hypothetical protein